MNGITAISVPQVVWSEATSPDGRVYYFNKLTKATQWTKPPELMTAVERALQDQPWQQHATKEGRKYWYHKETKESKWEMPDSYRDALAQETAMIPKPIIPAPQFVAGGTPSFSNFQRDDYGERLIGQGSSDFTNNAKNASGGTAHSTDPSFGSFEEAENAFLKLLRRSNVQSDWTWEQAMKATIKDPQYRSLKDPKDRRNTFERYIGDVQRQEKEKEKDRITKLRTNFTRMLKSHPEIKHYTRWRTARPIIEGETIFRSTSDDSERRQLFQEYMNELKKAQHDKLASVRKSAADDLVTILDALQLEPYTRWSEAHESIQTHERFKNDEKFKALSKSDILAAFENHIKTLERKFNDQRQREKSSRQRRERKARDEFIGLLRELRQDGKIKAGSRWMESLPLFEEDSRYQGLLGQPGSSPLDFFRDVVEEEERALRSLRNDVYDVLEDRKYEVVPQTTLIEFKEIMKSDRRTATIGEGTLQLLFDRLIEKVSRRSKEDKFASERQQRKLVDALRSRIKHLDHPAVTLTTTWEELKPQIVQLDEYKALESEDLCRQAFDKVLRRLKEKEHDQENQDRRSPGARSGTRSYHQNRDRDGRSGTHRRGPDRRTSQTPEPDAYEAERRKATADRERQHARTGRETFGSPPPSATLPASSTRARHRSGERPPSGRLNDYDRDRDHDRYRERDRERDSRYDTYHRSRADERAYGRNTAHTGRARRDELDYGTSGARGRRRRSAQRNDGESDEGEGTPVRKRSRRDRPSQSPEAETQMAQDKEKERDKKQKQKQEKEKEREKEQEEVVMHSGSEEGEMVEE